MTTCKSILTPTTKEPKICHALATTSAFNLKLCLKTKYAVVLISMNMVSEKSDVNGLTLKLLRDRSKFEIKFSFPLLSQLQNLWQMF